MIKIINSTKFLTETRTISCSVSNQQNNHSRKFHKDISNKLLKWRMKLRLLSRSIKETIWRGKWALQANISYKRNELLGVITAVVKLLRNIKISKELFHEITVWVAKFASFEAIKTVILGKALFFVSLGEFVINRFKELIYFWKMHGKGLTNIEHKANLKGEYITCGAILLGMLGVVTPDGVWKLPNTTRLKEILNTTIFATSRIIERTKNVTLAANLETLHNTAKELEKGSHVCYQFGHQHPFLSEHKLTGKIVKFLGIKGQSARFQMINQRIPGQHYSFLCKATVDSPTHLTSVFTHNPSDFHGNYARTPYQLTQNSKIIKPQFVGSIMQNTKGERAMTYNDLINKNIYIDEQHIKDCIIADTSAKGKQAQYFSRTANYSQDDDSIEIGNCEVDVPFTRLKEFLYENPEIRNHVLDYVGGLLP